MPLSNKKPVLILFIGLALVGQAQMFASTAEHLRQSERLQASRLAVGRKVFELCRTYLTMPEFVMEKELFKRFTKTIDPNYLPFHYPEAVITANEYQTLLTNFVRTYEIKSLPQERHVQKITIPPGAQIRFIGDLHGDIQALVRMLCKLMADGFLSGDLRIAQPNSYLIFLGDFVDYGRYGADTLAMMMRLRIVNPDNVLVCRGNHEDKHMNANQHNGFFQELESRYTPSEAANLKIKIDQAFSCLPLAIFLGIEGQMTSGFIQCCHGGLETNRANKKKIYQMLLDKDSSSKAVILESKASMSNLQWGDFTGIFLPDGFEDIPRRGIAFDINGVKAYMPDLLKYVFRGHQDKAYSCKNLIRDFVEPMCLIPVEVNDQQDLASNAECSDWLAKQNVSLDMLRESGFLLGELPDCIGPVFTFTNASSTKTNYDEGFGMLTVGETWETSRLRYYIARPNLFIARASLFDDANTLTYLQEPALKVISNEDDDFFSSAIIASLLLPLLTHIDASGKATIAIDGSNEEARLIRKNLLTNQLEDANDNEDANDDEDSSEDTNDDENTNAPDWHYWHECFIQKHSLPAGTAPGIAIEFENSILQRDIIPPQASASISDHTPTSKAVDTKDKVDVDNTDHDNAGNNVSSEIDEHKNKKPKTRY